MRLEPFANDADSITVGDLTVENGTDGISLYGRIRITRDREGLKLATELNALLHEIVNHLSADKDLPAHSEPEQPTGTMPNPFG